VPVDDLLRIALLRAVSRAAPGESTLRLDRIAGSALAELAATGRLVWERADGPALAPGPPRRAELVWRALPGEPTRYGVALADELVLVAAHDVCYLDLVASVLGPLEVGAPAALVQRLVHAPPVPAPMLSTVRRSLRPLLEPAAAAALAPVGPIDDGGTGVAEELPRPALSVGVARDPDGARRLDLRAEAVYGAERFELAVWEPRRPAPRDMAAEGALRRRLDELLTAARVGDRAAPDLAEDARALAHRVVPALAEEGWQWALDAALPVEPVVEPSAWVERLRPHGARTRWFSLELGVVVAGRTVALLPILLDAIRRGELPLDRDALEARELPGTTLRLPDGERVYVSAERLTRWLAPLVELALRGHADDGALELPAYAAARVVDAAPGRFAAPSALAALREAFADLLALGPVHEPASLAGELRPYQRQGLAWLQWLHDRGYGGLLADDMGLGKTVQVLAFLETLRVAGALGQGRPAVVVAPRTVVGHWRDEAARFAPRLSPVVHLGAGRATRAAELAGATLVITSYQTLLRDRALFAELDCATAIYDEAQALKNPATRLRKAVAAIAAHSRFGLTGTPIENHLSELWSQLDLVMPGLLGRRTTFDGVFRTPIEKYGSERALELLRQRIRPFLLRRAKRTVALELPAKTEIVELVELEPEQRDLYESLRLSLDQGVRAALAARGEHGVNLAVLDALLKLRQCCCDPRLVKTPTAAKVTGSAKLERLIAMLEELADAGRFTLVFSQFTSMLALIGEALAAAGIGYLELTGATRDRDGVVRAFQAGRAPVLLVSLKTGGTGLNLTRADTVIHYDPWWNPAAEDQATDRAHRIGQDRQVFVYKLVAQGTLEQRIVELQGAKRALTDAALAGGGASEPAAADLAALYHQLV
jgi:superfamily II DNA or RNA helicase